MDAYISRCLLANRESPFSMRAYRYSTGSTVHCMFQLRHVLSQCLLPPSPSPSSTVLSTIDQTEFEGFEYINPLLMSKVDDV